MDGIQIPYANTAKYFGMTLDANLHWHANFKIKIIGIQPK